MDGKSPTLRTPRLSLVKYRHLGRTGLRVSEIAYGNSLTHGDLVTTEAALACVQVALEAGVTTFDTADAYAQGAAEAVLGQALRIVRRESVEIATKVCLPMGGPNGRGLSRKHVMESCHASLRRLGTDYVDLYQAHRYDNETPLEETLVAFDDLVRQGKVLYLGVSEWTVEQIRAALDLAAELGLHSRIVSNQPQHNMLWRVIEAEVVPTCRELGLSQIVWSPMAQGVLTGKYLPGQQPPSGSRATTDDGPEMMEDYLSDRVLERVQQLKPIAQDAGLSMAQLAIAWVLQNDNVAAALGKDGDDGRRD